MGNLIITGSRDASVRFYDVASGTCIKTLSKSLGEISSLALNMAGDKLLTGSKVSVAAFFSVRTTDLWEGTIYFMKLQDSCNRLFDIRKGDVIQRYKGHQNSKLNFVRASFGPGDALICGGSEDGRVFVWDVENGSVLTKLSGHSGPVFRAIWSDRAGRLASCAEDGLVRLWGA